MRPGTVLGALLIFAGVVALSVGGFSFTSREKVAEVGPVKVTTEKSHSVPIPTVVAGWPSLLASSSSSPAAARHDSRSPQENRLGPNSVDRWRTSRASLALASDGVTMHY
jgi:hypothetical protein